MPGVRRRADIKALDGRAKMEAAWAAARLRAAGRRSALSLIGISSKQRVGATDEAGSDPVGRRNDVRRPDRAGAPALDLMPPTPPHRNVPGQCDATCEEAPSETRAAYGKSWVFSRTLLASPTTPSLIFLVGESGRTPPSFFSSTLCGGGMWSTALSSKSDAATVRAPCIAHVLATANFTFSTSCAGLRTSLLQPGLRSSHATP